MFRPVFSLSLLISLKLLICNPLSAEQKDIASFFFQRIECSSYFELPEPIASFGDNLFLRGEYNGASIEYNRELLVSQFDETRFRLALALIKSGEYSQSENELEKLLVCDDLDIKGRAERVLGFLKIQKGEFSRARFEFNNLRNIADDNLEKAELSYWIGWTYLLEYNFELAKKEFQKVADEKSRENKLYTSSYLLARDIEIKIPELDNLSPSLAKWLSMVVPGSGQVYVGEYQSAVISFLLNSAFGYITVNAFIYENYFQGFCYFYFLFSRYYFGGGDNSYRLATDYNIDQRNEIVGDLIDKHLTCYEE